MNAFSYAQVQYTRMGTDVKERGANPIDALEFQCPKKYGQGSPASNYCHGNTLITA